MAISVGSARPVADDADRLTRVIGWIKTHKQLSLWVAAILVVGGGLVWWNALSTRQSEQSAGRALVSARLAFESSPMASVKSWRSPVLLIHGDDDRNVPFSESVNLAEALRRQGVTVEQLIFPDEVHDILIHARWVEAYRAAADFLDRKISSKFRVPSSK